MGGVQVFDLKYIDVLLFYSVEILNTKSLGSRFQPNIQSIMNSIICRDGYYTCDIIVFLQDFLFYLRKIYLHLHIWCVIRIALCIFIFYTQGPI